eukprot:GILI01013483.1.p1 GENE.GILI01013483.1~~GILI01013483.1.p1  ORF type:complete len:258 (+),score=56.83 GILI01013483.1:60-833(+)
MTETTATAQHFKVRVFLDVDNTLYSYDETKFHFMMHDNINGIFAKVLPEIEAAEALKLANRYHHEYGLALAGLARHHHTDERPIDLTAQCRVANTCDYGVLKENKAVVDMLQAMKDEDGYDLWLFTNADEPHAISCIEGIGIKHLFHEQDGYFKCIDCHDQWGTSTFEALTNKPHENAYTLADSKAQGRFKIDNDFVRVMVDDVVDNLRAPGAMGWITVWISYGKPFPENSDVKPTIIIPTVEGLREALKAVLTKDE